ncbi:Alpha/Beta hydrolase protein [Aspergillus pseudocaelatus]|uniref:Alpha/Beta hydrolase protein n=1 Tax=Aspergillus pseudocaelatus TaxID=1825620 RepID=A0ABQ6X3U1_9EURO|nr:Alpha/Beta hydrolase protein [Aspergillus pseudocaelatus]
MDSIHLNQIFHHSTATHRYQIRWTSLGDDALPPLIFVHGTPWSSRVWDTYARSFARYFHVYLFDNPGFGESPLGQPLQGKENIITKELALDADLAQQSEVFAALYHYWAQDWKHPKAHVIAHDHGGLMTLRAHILHGCEYASLCLINVVALGPFGQSLFELVAENEEVFNALTGPVFEGVVESYIRDAAYSELRKETMEMLKRPWISSEEGRKGFVRQMVQANSRHTDEVEGKYPEVGKEMPVRIIWGKEDKWIPVETADRLKEKLGARDVVVIEEAGHLVIDKDNAEKPISSGFFRLEKDAPLVHTYMCDEMKIITEGEFQISDETG